MPTQSSGFLAREAGDVDWDKHRVQMVWDAIALHATTSIAWHKEPEVVATSYGINAEFFRDRIVRKVGEFELGAVGCGCERISEAEA